MLPNPTVVRLGLMIDEELLAWMRERPELGWPAKPATHDSHAVEVALRRLHEEQEFIQQQCARHEVDYTPAAFWNMFEELRAQSVPNPRGRRRPETHVDRQEMWATLDAHWQKWMDRQCRDGLFESAGHLIETCFRYLRQIAPAPRPVSLLGFPFDDAARWAAYQKELVALGSRRKP